MKVSLLTGGDDPSYAIPLMSSLASKGIEVDFIGNDQMQRSEAVNNERVNYLNLRGDQSENAPVTTKIIRVSKYYSRLVKYAFQTDSRIFHILWLNKFILFDRTILNLYYKMLGKKLVFTAHNVNAGVRDGNDSLMNRLTLRFMYRIMDHIFVHTIKMKTQLAKDFHVPHEKISVIPFGINNFVPRSELKISEARSRLGLHEDERALLFFGQIAPYKGLELLISALNLLKTNGDNYRLIIAGKVKATYEKYWQMIRTMIKECELEAHITERVEFIPDEEVEVYFKGADVLILPYRDIYQTGVLYLSYNFGLPAIATDVGSLNEEIVEGQTGFVCKPDDPEDLAKKIGIYFESSLFRNLEAKRREIEEYANEKYSWQAVAEATYSVYAALQ